jgi:F0F1-type ATP synthase assembly protein I
MRNLLDQDEQSGEPEPKAPGPSATGLGLFDDPAEKNENEPYVLSDAPRESQAEVFRKSGLAWSAGVAMFSSIVFMLVLGWGADLLFGTSPWGLVVGIVIGSLIGFVQLFRISSQIFQK